MCEKSRVFLFHIFVSFYRLTGPFLFYFADFVRQRLFFIFPLKVFAGIGARPVRIDPLAHGGPLTAVLTSSVAFSRVWGQIWVFTMSSHLLLKYWLLYWSAIVIILDLAMIFNWEMLLHFQTFYFTLYKGHSLPRTLQNISRLLFVLICKTKSYFSREFDNC